MMRHFAPSYFLDPNHPIVVYLIGAGGTGSQVLSVLARMNEALLRLDHPGLHVVTFDADEVSPSNVGRQLFSPQDIGANKAVALTSRLNRFYGTEWEAVSAMFDVENKQVLDAWTGRHLNIVISCVDSAAARFGIAKAIAKISKDEVIHDKLHYWLDTGNARTSGQVVLGTVKPVEQPASSHETVSVLPTILDLFPDMAAQDTEEVQGPTCSVAEALRRQDLFVNSHAAIYAGDILWKLFKEGSLAASGVFFNSETFQANPLQIDRKTWERFGFEPKLAGEKEAA